MAHFKKNLNENNILAVKELRVVLVLCLWYDTLGLNTRCVFLHIHLLLEMSENTAQKRPGMVH